jgi:hypothetical protein
MEIMVSHSKKNAPLDGFRVCDVFSQFSPQLHFAATLLLGVQSSGNLLSNPLPSFAMISWTSLNFQKLGARKSMTEPPISKNSKKNIITLDQGHPETWGTLGTTDSSPA